MRLERNDGNTFTGESVFVYIYTHRGNSFDSKIEHLGLFQQPLLLHVLVFEREARVKYFVTFEGL